MHTLQVVLEQAEAARDAAQAQSRRAFAAQRGAQAQLEQLVGYRGDYERRYAERFACGAAIDVLRGWQAFMQRLDQAIAQQTRLAQQHREQADAARAALLDAERQVAAVGKLIERRLAAERRATARHEQRAADEQSARLGALRRA